MAGDVPYSIDPLPAGPDVPEAPDGFLGVAIACPEQVRLDGEWRLNGFFRLPEADLKAIDEQPHRALTLVATLGGSWYADSPLREKIFFPDDLCPEGDVLRGWFSFDLVQLFGGGAPGTYRVTVSLGEHLSDTLRVEVG